MPQKQKLERLDKVIAAQTKLSRRDVQRLVGRGQISVNGTPVKKADLKIDPDTDVVMVSGKTLALKRHVYIMLNKPRGVVCATSAAALPTVLDLVPDSLMRRGLFPAGRLDKDTEGFVLITDDGAFAHRILAPKSHVPKTYTARLDAPVTQQMIEAFAAGVQLDGAVCMPAELCVLDTPDTARVVIRQGMYHQIKRMFAACGAHVLALRRDRIGGLSLDIALGPGECRELSAAEAARIALVDA